jgi:hypothetical protein
MFNLKTKYMKSINFQPTTKPAIVGNNVLCPVVLDVLHEWHRKESGWWYGYTKLMIDVRDRMGKEIPLSHIKEALRELRKQGLVKVEPIYKEESGMLNGSGYFYNGA